MPPRFQTLPPAQTAAAREAQKSFYCQLCQKGYSRMNEYEAHLSSYDHSHKQRLKDMKQMVRDPQAAARARKQEAKADGVISIKLGADSAGGSGAAAGGGFKKGGFKKSGFKAAFVPVEGAKAEEPVQEDVAKVDEPLVALGKKSGDDTGYDPVESDTEDEGYEVYDPRHPTD
ncbi:hypothetical protein CONLIGDRAFT_679548 [Coniochaeta ligniaria NRRL 30616]|uniref:C2H2-type domain-containing protein n=1 Tax=Coniochaeta ligniaria NRRL 30616 TaxID=1408157 RepID=A0A1J7JSR0_9PEZI|nr:hypothetical protein CONLIGDRAFT_679548 [Coniochaeta ligniaria NRRL 30616]